MEPSNAPSDDRPGILPAGSPTLYCTECEYNLTGLTENRCPECGTAFEPAALARIYSGEDRHILPWGNREQDGWLRAFLGTCLETFFSPREFIRRFPWAFDRADAIEFWFVARLVTGAIANICYLACTAVSPFAAADQFFAGWAALIAAGLVVSVGVFFVEACIATVLNVLAPPRVRPRPGPDDTFSTSWWGVIAMFGGFQPLAVAVLGVVIVAGELSNAFESAILGAMFAFSTVPWWLGCLASAVDERARPGTGRTVAVALLWVMTVAAALVAVLLVSSISASLSH